MELHAAQFVPGELRGLEQDLLRDARLADVVQQTREAELLDVFDRQSELLADEHRVVHDASRVSARHVLAGIECRGERRDGLGVVVADAAEQRGAAEGSAGVRGETVEQRAVLGVVATAVGARHEQLADVERAVRELDGDRRPVVAHRDVADKRPRATWRGPHGVERVTSDIASGDITQNRVYLVDVYLDRRARCRPGRGRSSSA